jgi:hypothetical protein
MPLAHVPEYSCSLYEILDLIFFRKTADVSLRENYFSTIFNLEDLSRRLNELSLDAKPFSQLCRQTDGPRFVASGKTVCDLEGVGHFVLLHFRQNGLKQASGQIVTSVFPIRLHELAATLIKRCLIVKLYLTNRN